MMRRSLPILLKVSVSFGLVVYLFNRIEIEGVLNVMRSAHRSYLAVVLVAYLATQLISALRWAVLARAVGFEKPLREFAVYYLIGMFFNLFAPSTVGGDVGRVYYLASSGPGSKGKSWIGWTATALSTVIADRAVGMAVLIWVATAALLVFPAYEIPLPIRTLTFGLGLGLLLGWLLLPFIYHLLRRAIQPLGEGLRIAVETYISKPRVVSKCMGLSVIIHFSQAVLHVLLGWALDLQIPWSYSFILYPLVGAFSAIPISLNGIGLREGGYLFMLQRINVSAEKALAFSLLWFMVGVLDSMVGGIVFIFRRRRKPVVEEERS